MRIAILAQDFEAYSTCRLAEVLSRRGHDLTLVSPTDCTVHMGQAGPEEAGGAGVWHRGQSLRGTELVLLRCVAATTPGLSVIRPLETSIALQLGLTGARCVNQPQAKQLAQDKFLSLQVLSQAGVPVPDTFLTWSPEQLEAVVRQHLGTPVVLKTLQGTWGVGVMRADSVASARAIFETLGGMERLVMAQRYIPEAARQDIRAIVVGQEVLGAFRRRTPPDEFRANIHRGGSAEMVDLPAGYAKMAVAAAQALGLDLAGVDLVETEAGPLVLEVNATPGWKQIERLSDIDATGRIAAFVEELARG